MRKTILAAGLCLLAFPAAAQGLRGQWDATSPNVANFTGTLLVDTERRVTYDSPQDGGRPAKYRGYIAQIDDMNVSAKLTNGDIVVQMNCAILSSDFLNCRATFPGGRKGDEFMLKRVGPGPRTLMQSSR